RPFRADRIPRRHDGVADANRVPPACRPCRSLREGDVAARADPHRLASWRDRSRQHARRLRRTPAPQAEEAVARARDQDDARSGVPVAMRLAARLRALRPGLRGRLLLSVVGAIALVLALLTAGFNLVLDSRLDHDANNVVAAR